MFAIRFTAVWVALTAGCGCVYAQRLNSSNNQGQLVPGAQIIIRPDYDWTKDYWIQQDDIPFVEARSDIDKEFASTRSSSSIVSEYQDSAGKLPKDPIAQFRLAYSQYLAYHQSFVEDPLNNPMVSVVQPHSYQYTRLLFLVSSPVTPLRIVGERLLEREPDNDDIKSKLIFVCILSLQKDIPGLKQKLIGWCQALMKKYPHDPKYVKLLAEVYEETWYVSKSKVDARLSLTYFHQYLGFVPVGTSDQGAIEGTELLTDWLRNH